MVTVTMTAPEWLVWLVLSFAAVYLVASIANTYYRIKLARMAR